MVVGKWHKIVCVGSMHLAFECSQPEADQYRAVFKNIRISFVTTAKDTMM